MIQQKEEVARPQLTAFLLAYAYDHSLLTELPPALVESAKISITGPLAVPPMPRAFQVQSISATIGISLRELACRFPTVS
jgi:hypothetical protein